MPRGAQVDFSEDTDDGKPWKVSTSTLIRMEITWFPAIGIVFFGLDWFVEHLLTRFGRRGMYSILSILSEEREL